jgi:hypothetical protein
MGFSMRLEGLDQITEQFGGVVAALHELENRVASIRIEPNDEASIRAAILSIDEEVDRLLLPYKANEIVAAVANQFKDSAAENIRRRAAQAGDRA